MKKTEEIVKKHLEGFVSSFIKKQYRERWMYVLFQKKSKVIQEFKKFENKHDEKYVSFYEELHSHIYSNMEGLYYNDNNTYKIISFAEAVELNSYRSEDAIFSITPGKLAFFFFHEGWIWKCEKM